MNNKNDGLTLIETLLTLGTITVLAAGVYVALKPASASALAKSEQQNLSEFSQMVSNSFGLVGNYEGVSTSRLISERNFPLDMLKSGRLASGWNGSVQVEPYAVNSAGDSFVITYLDTPKDVCNKLAAGASTLTYDILINGESSFTNKLFSPISAASLCDESSKIEFVFFGNTGSSYAADPLDLPPSPASVRPDLDIPITNVVDDAGGVPDATETPFTGTNPGSGAVPTIPAIPASPTPSTVNPAPAPSSPTTPPAINIISECQAGYEDRPGSCPSGQYGSSIERQILACELASNPGVPESWVPTNERLGKGWSNYSSGTCAACPNVPRETLTQWVSYTSNNCPSGQYGYTNRSKEQSRYRDGSYNCPAGTTSLPAPNYGAWSAWVDTGNSNIVSSVCKSCPAASSERRTQWVAAADSNCPVGQSGTIKNEKEQSSTRATNYNCPIGTTSIPAATYGAWATWSDTGIKRVVSNNCANACASASNPYTNVQAQNCGASTSNGAYADVCDSWADIGTYDYNRSSAIGKYGPSYRGAVASKIRFTFNNVVYTCSYSSSMYSSGQAGSSGSPNTTLPAGISCGSANWYASSSGNVSFSFGYTSCP